MANFLLLRFRQPFVLQRIGVDEPILPLAVAFLAERDAIDRYLASLMAGKIGARFTARVSGVTRFGLFVTVADSGATGIVPMNALPDDYWHHDEMEQTLTGRRTRQVFRLSQDVTVRLAEANPVTGGLVFQIWRDQGPGRRVPDPPTTEQPESEPRASRRRPSGARPRSR